MAFQALQNIFSEYLKQAMSDSLKRMIDWLFVAWTFTNHACSVFDRHLELGSNLQSEFAISRHPSWESQADPGSTSPDFGSNNCSYVQQK